MSASALSTSLPLGELAAAGGSGADPAWLAARRDAARAEFARRGVPTSRDEEWRFTPVAPLGQREWRTPAEGITLRHEDIAPYLFGQPSWPRIVLVDGAFSTELSSLPLSGGISVQPLSLALDSDSAVEQHLTRLATPELTPFAALNAALFADGVVIRVAAGAVISDPVHVLHVATTGADDAVVSPRTLVVIEREARASVVESFIALADVTYFTNAACEVVLGEAAWLEHVRVQREGGKAWHVGLTRVDQARDSHYRSFTLAMGGRLSRHDLQAKHNASNIETLLYGLYLTRGEQLVDNHTAIHHDFPHCNSWEVYKGVLAERSRAVFNGKVLVHADAQKTDAKQTNRNLLLSDDAKVDTKPQLEIFADDVKCTHGATVGRLDPQQRYYLATRGIGGRTAQALLIWAFAAEVLAEVSVEPVREALEAVVRTQLDALIS